MLLQVRTKQKTDYKCVFLLIHQEFCYYSFSIPSLARILQHHYSSRGVKLVSRMIEILF